MKECPHCYGLTPVESSYCIRCGAALSTTGVGMPPREHSQESHPPGYPNPQEIGNPDIGNLLAQIPNLFTLRGCLFLLAVMTICSFVSMILESLFRFSP